MKLLCPKCETWYSSRHFKAGELCGDRTVTKPGPCSGLLVDLALAVEAMSVAAETGRTPAQLAAERAELVAVIEEIAGGMGNLSIEEIGDAGVHGIRDGKARAIYLERFVCMSRAILAKVKK